MASIPPWFRRALLICAEVGLWITAGVLAILLGAFIVLGQGWGSGVVHRALAAVSAGFLGRIEVGTARVFPDGSVIATNANILDPDGKVVIHVDRAVARANLWKLFQQELELTSAQASGVTADFGIDQQGDVNIARVFQPRHPGPPAAPGTPSGGGFEVVIGGIDVDAKRVGLTIAPSSRPLVEVQHAHLRGRVEITRRGEVIIDPELSRASLLGPVSGPLTVEGRMTLVGTVLTADATAHVADSSLQAECAINLAGLAGHLEVRELIAGPETLGTWLGPQRPWGARASLSAELAGTRLYVERARVQPLQGPGTIDLRGALDLQAGDGDLNVAGHGIDARTFFAVLPSSDVGFHLDGRFARVFGDDRSGQAHLEMEAWSWDGEIVGPGRADLAYAANQLRFTNVDLAVPGARLVGEGALALPNQKIEARIDLRAPSLGRLRKAVESIGQLKLPGIEGDARVKATVKGSLSDLALNADLHSEHVLMNGLRADDVTAHLEAPRIGRKMNLRGHVTLGDLKVADETFQKLDLTVGWQTPELSLLARAAYRDQGVEVSMRGLLSPSFERAEIEELTLTLPDGKWELQLPAHFDLEDGVTFRDFGLASGQQRLVLNLSARSTELTIRGEVENLDLGKIPFLEFRGQAAKGILNAELAYREGHRHREAQAQVDIQGFTLDRLQVPSLRANASLNDAQVTAAVDGTFGSGGVHLRFSGPLPSGTAGSMPIGPRGQLNGNLAITGLNLADFTVLVPELKPYSGHLALELGLAGDWAMPRVTLTATAEQLQGPWMAKPPTGIGSLSVETHFQTGDRASQLEATVIDEQNTSTTLVDVKSSVGVGSRQLGALVPEPGTVVRFRDFPIQIAVETAALPLKALGRIVPDLSTARGTAQLSADIRGSTRAPRGKASIALRDFGFPHRRLGTIQIDAHSGDTGLTLEAKMDAPPEQGGNLGLKARWDLRPEELANAAARGRAPLSADLQATNLPLALLLGKRSELQGRAAAAASLSGSLDRPTLKSRLDLTVLEVDDKPAGSLAATADWDGQQLAATLDGDQPSGGKVAARLELPLTTAGLGSGPLSAKLQAQAFDLAMFQPVLVQTRAVRALGGTLDADLSIAGTRAKPTANGTLDLTRGELALAGVGELQHIELKARVDADSLVVEHLFAKSGGGPLTATLAARRADASAFTLEGHLETTRFGIYLDDQLRALLTSKSDISGKLTFPGPGADVMVAVRDASVHIPSLTQKNLAPTTLDPDIHISSWRPPQAQQNTAEEDKPAETDTAKAGPPIYLRISAPGPIEVRGPDVRLDAKANLAVRLASEAELTGLVAVDHGEINALGRTFKVYRANVRFGDARGDFAPPGSGRLDIQAGQEVGGYRVSLVVLGRIDHPVPQLTSDPPLPRAQIGQLLATGSNDADTGAQGSGGSLVSNLFVEGLKNWLKVSPPLDVLTVDPNRLEAGKRITPQLYLGVTNNYAVMDPRVNGTEVHARYELGHHLALDGRYGTSQAGSFDLQWRHNW